MKIHFAPMQGYADHVYRRFHAQMYGGIDMYYTPFIRIEGNEPRRQDMARLEESLRDGMPLRPQIIFGSEREFKLLVASLKALGIDKIDLNLGCPYPMQTGKGRGAAMVARPDEMRLICNAIAEDADVSYSVKMRLGLDDCGQWRALMPMLNGAKLDHVAVHPRIAKQMYKGDLNYDEFRQLVAESMNPVIYNGEIRSIEDIAKITEEYPEIDGVMIGRGLLARPSLVQEWSEGREWTQSERMSRLIEFHAKIYETYKSTLCGATQILQKIKPFWEYLEPEIGHKAYKAIKKSCNLKQYEVALGNI